jgi:cation diffusion facilitator family transporter
VLEAVQRIDHPQPIRSGLFLAVASAGLAVNLISLVLLHGARTGSLNARGAYLHVMGDALGSVAALGAAAIIWSTGWTVADPIASIALSLLILIGAWRLLRESTDILLESVPGHVSMPEVQRRILGVPGVLAVHDLHVWTVANGVVAMSGHAVVPDLEAHPGVQEGIRGEMAQLGIGHVTIQLEIEDECGTLRELTPARHPEPGHLGHRH